MAKTLTTSWQNIASWTTYDSGYALSFYVDARYTSQNVTNNTTTVETRLTSVTNSTTWSGDYHTFECTYANTVNYHGRWTYESETITSGSSTVTHDSDGSKSVWIQGRVYDSAWGWNQYFGDTVILPTIPRYANVTTTTSNIKEDSVDISWSSDAYVDTAQYRLNSGNWVNVQTGLNTKSGSYTITGLEPGTAYRIDFDYKRRDSQQWSYSAGHASTSYITTLDYMTYVNVNGSWKKGIPYIKINGSWKKATPYMKINGTWKKGIN